MGLLDGTDVSFGEEHFGQARLGDRRRTRRLVEVADRLVKHPSGSLPNKMGNPMDLKALYRLMEKESVTHASVLEPHCERTRRTVETVSAERTVLILHDTTELDFTQRHSLDGMGQVGNGIHRGWLCHNSLAIAADSREVIGLCNQILHVRPIKPKRKKGEKKKKKSPAQSRAAANRESLLWLQGVQGCGSVPPTIVSVNGTDDDLSHRRPPRVVDVCDRGADTFEFIEHEMRHGRSFVIRSKHNRALVGHKHKLHAHARHQPELGRRTLEVAGNLARSRRTATVALSAAQVSVRAPQQRHGQHANEPLTLWIVRVWEVDAPPNATSEKPLEWLLVTDVPVATFEEAERIADWYGCRPLIEEYHKAQKTGCNIEDMQFHYAERMQPAIALMSVIALKLLALRDASRRPDAKSRPATEVLHRDYVETLSLWRYKTVRMDISVHEFYFALARLGGHQNRKRDGNPGWLTLWRGWEKLHLLDLGIDNIRLRRRSG